MCIAHPFLHECYSLKDGKQIICSILKKHSDTKCGIAWTSTCHWLSGASDAGPPSVNDKVIFCFIGVLAFLGCGWMDVDLWKQKGELKSVFTGHSRGPLAVNTGRENCYSKYCHGFYY